MAVVFLWRLLLARLNQLFRPGSLVLPRGRNRGRRPPQPRSKTTEMAEQQSNRAPAPAELRRAPTEADMLAAELARRMAPPKPPLPLPPKQAVALGDATIKVLKRISRG